MLTKEKKPPATMPVVGLCEFDLKWNLAPLSSSYFAKNKLVVSFVDFVFLKRDDYPSGKKTSSFLPSFLHPLSSHQFYGKGTRNLFLF
jgi:hypothetical protein